MIRGLQNGNVNNQLLSLLGDLRREQEIPDRFIIKSGGRVVFLRVEEIDWMRAVGNYVRLPGGRDSHLMRETMTEWKRNSVLTIYAYTSLDHRQSRSCQRSATLGEG
jgi:DNA-binding LytR/AlgR family response regulator